MGKGKGRSKGKGGTPQRSVVRTRESHNVSNSSHEQSILTTTDSKVIKKIISQSSTTTTKKTSEEMTHNGFSTGVFGGNAGSEFDIDLNDNKVVAELDPRFTVTKEHRECYDTGPQEYFDGGKHVKYQESGNHFYREAHYDSNDYQDRGVPGTTVESNRVTENGEHFTKDGRYTQNSGRNQGFAKSHRYSDQDHRFSEKHEREGDGRRDFYGVPINKEIGGSRTSLNIPVESQRFCDTGFNRRYSERHEDRRCSQRNETEERNHHDFYDVPIKKMGGSRTSLNIQRDDRGFSDVGENRHYSERSQRNEREQFDHRDFYEVPVSKKMAGSRTSLNIPVQIDREIHIPLNNAKKFSSHRDIPIQFEKSLNKEVYDDEYLRNEKRRHPSNASSIHLADAVPDAYKTVYVSSSNIQNERSRAQSVNRVESREEQNPRSRSVSVSRNNLDGGAYDLPNKEQRLSRAPSYISLNEKIVTAAPSFNHGEDVGRSRHDSVRSHFSEKGIEDVAYEEHMSRSNSRRSSRKYNPIDQMNQDEFLLVGGCPQTSNTTHSRLSYTEPSDGRTNPATWRASNASLHDQGDGAPIGVEGFYGNSSKPTSRTMSAHSVRDQDYRVLSGLLGADGDYAKTLGSEGHMNSRGSVPEITINDRREEDVRSRSHSLNRYGEHVEIPLNNMARDHPHSRATSKCSITTMNTDDRLLLASEHRSRLEDDIAPVPKTRSRSTLRLDATESQDQLTEKTIRSQKSTSEYNDRVLFSELPTLHSHPDDVFGDDVPGEPFRPTKEHSFTPNIRPTTKPPMRPKTNGEVSIPSNNGNREPLEAPVTPLMYSSALTPVGKRLSNYDMSNVETPNTVINEPRCVRKMFQPLTTEVAIQTGDSIRVRPHQDEPQKMYTSKSIHKPIMNSSFEKNGHPAASVLSNLLQNRQEITEREVVQRERLHHVSERYSESEEHYNKDVDENANLRPRGVPMNAPRVIPPMAPKASATISPTSSVRSSTNGRTPSRTYQRRPLSPASSMGSRNDVFYSKLNSPTRNSDEELVQKVADAKWDGGKNGGGTLKLHVPPGKIKHLASAFDNLEVAKNQENALDKRPRPASNSRWKLSVPEYSERIKKEKIEEKQDHKTSQTKEERTTRQKYEESNVDKVNVDQREQIRQHISDEKRAQYEKYCEMDRIRRENHQPYLQHQHERRPQFDYASQERVGEGGNRQTVYRQEEERNSRFRRYEEENFDRFNGDNPTTQKRQESVNSDKQREKMFAGGDRFEAASNISRHSSTTGSRAADAAPNSRESLYQPKTPKNTGAPLRDFEGNFEHDFAARPCSNRVRGEEPEKFGTLTKIQQGAVRSLRDNFETKTTSKTSHETSNVRSRSAVPPSNRLLYSVPKPYVPPDRSVSNASDSSSVYRQVKPARSYSLRRGPIDIPIVKGPPQQPSVNVHNVYTTNNNYESVTNHRYTDYEKPIYANQRNFRDIEQKAESHYPAPTRNGPNRVPVHHSRENAHNSYSSMQHETVENINERQHRFPSYNGHNENFSGPKTPTSAPLPPNGRNQVPQVNKDKLWEERVRRREEEERIDEQKMKTERHVAYETNQYGYPQHPMDHGDDFHQEEKRGTVYTTDDACSRITHPSFDQRGVRTDEESIRGKIDKMFAFVENDDLHKSRSNTMETPVDVQFDKPQPSKKTFDQKKSTKDNGEWERMVIEGSEKRPIQPSMFKKNLQNGRERYEHVEHRYRHEIHETENVAYSLNDYRNIQREVIGRNEHLLDQEPQFFRSPAAVPHAGQSLHTYRAKDIVGTPAIGEKLVSNGREVPIALATSTPNDSPHSHRAGGHNCSETFVSSISGVSMVEVQADYRKRINKLQYMIETSAKQMTLNELALSEAQKSLKVQQEIAAHRALLISRETLRLQRHELRHLHALSAVRRPPPPVSRELKSSVSFSNITIHLNKNFCQRHNDNGSYAFVVLLKSGYHVEATEFVLLLNDSTEYHTMIHFGQTIHFSDLPVDFDVSLEVYAMRVPHPRLVEPVSTSLKEKCMSLIGPPQKKVQQQPIDHLFRIRGRMILDRDAAGHRRFYLDEVSYPLEGTIDINSQCSRLPEAIDLDYRGFMAIYQTVGNMASWERYWAVLRRGVVFFWKYPDDESMNKCPLMQMDLTKCTNQSIEQCPADICPRPNSFHIEMLINAQSELIEKKRVLLSADTPEMLNSWLMALNETLSVIRGPTSHVGQREVEVV